MCLFYYIFMAVSKISELEVFEMFSIPSISGNKIDLVFKFWYFRSHFSIFSLFLKKKKQKITNKKKFIKR